MSAGSCDGRDCSLVCDGGLSLSCVRVGFVTALSEPTAIEQALAVIDAELLRLAARDMCTATEASNTLLDVRLLLSPSVTVPDEIPAEPVTA